MGRSHAFCPVLPQLNLEFSFAGVSITHDEGGFHERVEKRSRPQLQGRFPKSPRTIEMVRLVTATSPAGKFSRLPPIFQLEIVPAILLDLILYRHFQITFQGQFHSANAMNEAEVAKTSAALAPRASRPRGTPEIPPFGTPTTDSMKEKAPLVS